MTFTDHYDSLLPDGDTGAWMFRLGQPTHQCDRQAVGGAGGSHWLSWCWGGRPLSKHPTEGHLLARDVAVFSIHWVGNTKKHFTAFPTHWENSPCVNIKETESDIYMCVYRDVKAKVWWDNIFPMRHYSTISVVPQRRVPIMTFIICLCVAFNCDCWRLIFCGHLEVLLATFWKTFVIVQVTWAQPFVYPAILQNLGKPKINNHSMVSCKCPILERG